MTSALASGREGSLTATMTSLTGSGFLAAVTADGSQVGNSLVSKSTSLVTGPLVTGPLVTAPVGGSGSSVIPVGRLFLI